MTEYISKVNELGDDLITKGGEASDRLRIAVFDERPTQRFRTDHCVFGNGEHNVAGERDNQDKGIRKAQRLITIMRREKTDRSCPRKNVLYRRRDAMPAMGQQHVIGKRKMELLASTTMPIRSALVGEAVKVAEVVVEALVAVKVAEARPTAAGGKKCQHCSKTSHMEPQCWKKAT